MTDGERFVTISCFTGEMNRFVGAGHDAVVAVDVIRATTTAVTAVALGRRCFVVATLDAATRLQAELGTPLLVGELGGDMPHGFDLTNSPAALAERRDLARPMILLSTSGTRLVCAARGNVYLGCLRNHAALSGYLADNHRNVLVVGAGTRGEFREEDILCCAWIAAGLVKSGYRIRDAQTARVIREWANQPVDALLGGKSTKYLRATRQIDDLHFILGHVDDLDCIVSCAGNEVRQVDAEPHYRLTRREYGRV